MKESKKIKNKKDLIIEIVLVIIIIILLLHNCSLMNKKEKKPTGNVDVIDIDCNDGNCDVDKGEKTIDCLSDKTNDVCMIPNFVGMTKEEVLKWLGKLSNDVNIEYRTVESQVADGTILEQSITGVMIDELIESGETIIIDISSNEDTSEDISPVIADSSEPVMTDDDFYVNDSDIKWSKETELKIFTNPLYSIEGKIAPESSNTYKFVVNNETEYNLKYSISFIETNPYNINMKYKLKKNDTYIVDHYVSYSELNVMDILLNSKSKDTYYLEWKWVSSDNDTDIGIEASEKDVNYRIKINMEAESV